MSVCAPIDLINSTDENSHFILKSEFNTSFTTKGISYSDTGCLPDVFREAMEMFDSVDAMRRWWYSHDITVLAESLEVVHDEWIDTSTA
jgi:hypothetical protein